MLKKTVRYKNVDGDIVTRDLYFHIDETDIASELALIDRFENFKKRVIEGPSRELSVPEKQELVDLIEVFARLSYGVRLPNGEFRKNKEQWLEFREGLAWRAFFWPMLTEENEFNLFMQGIMPDNLAAELRKQLGQMQGQDELPLDDTPPSIPQPVEKPISEMNAEELRARLAQLES